MDDHAPRVSRDPAPAEPPHGGRVQAAARAYPGAPAPWIDLSTGISPYAYPIGTLPPDAWTRLPEPEDLAALERAAAAAYDAGPAWEVVAAPGTSALIAALARLCPGPAAIVGPTYGEYHAAWPDALVVPAPGSAFRSRPVRIVCQPDNPAGTVHDPGRLVQDAPAAGLLIVDESYADFAPGVSVVPHCPSPAGVVVLRSFGKAYGLAGLRLGFALTGPGLARRLRRVLGPWPVSGPAIRIGCAALSDAGWRDRVRQQLEADRAALHGLLCRSGFAGLAGTPLFLSACHDWPGWFDHLAGQGILTRAFADRPGVLRFGLPGEPAAWTRLAAALATGAR